MWVYGFVGLCICLFFSFFLSFFFLSFFVRETNVFRPISSVNVRYFCKLCVVEKNVAVCFLKKIPAFRVPCERIIYKIVGRKKLEKKVQYCKK